MGTPISNVDVTPLFLRGKLSSCEHRAETFAVTAQLSLPLLPYVLIEMFVSTLLLQSGMSLQWADFRSDKGTQLRCRSLCCGCEIGTCQLLVSVGERRSLPRLPQTLESSSCVSEYWNIKCFPMELLLLPLALEPNKTKGYVRDVTDANLFLTWHRYVLPVTSIVVPGRLC